MFLTINLKLTLIKQILTISSLVKLNGILICLSVFSGCTSPEELSVEPEDHPVISERVSESIDQYEDENEPDSVKSIEQIQSENKLRETYRSHANELTNFYIYAQHLFYNSDFEEALFWIEQAEKVQINADVLALKGNIYLGLGNFDEFENYWRRALEIDENVPVPPIPTIVRELKNRGLLDEDQKKNF